MRDFNRLHGSYVGLLRAAVTIDRWQRGIRDVDGNAICVNAVATIEAIPAIWSRTVTQEGAGTLRANEIPLASVPTAVSKAMMIATTLATTASASP